MRGILIAITLGLTALTFYSALWFKSETIERDITKRVTENLNETGAKDIGIDVDGRHVTLSGIVYDADVEAAHLDTADTTYGALGPIDGLTYLPDGGYISASKTDTGITLRGTVPNEAARAGLLAAATEATDGAVDDQLTISGPVAGWQDEATFGMTQLAGLTTGTMTAAAGAYALSGVTDGDAAAVEGAVSERDGWQAFVSTPRVNADLSQEVGRLNGDIAELKTSVAARDDTIAGLRTDINGLNTSVSDLTQERDTLGVELETLRASMTEGQTDAAALREQLAAAQTDIDTANGVIAERDGTITDLETQTDGLNGRISELETELANRQVDLGSTDQQVSALSLAVSGLNGDLAARDAEIAKLTGDVAARDDTIATLNGSLEDAQAQVTTLEEEVTERAVEISDLTRVVVARNETIAAKDGAVADAQAKITALEQDVSARDATIGETETQIARLQTLIQERDTTIGEAETQVATLQTVVQQRDATIEALQNRTPVTTNAAQCAAQASSVMEGSQINFRTATATIEDTSVELLERLTGIALACVGTDLTVEVGGHTDSQGTDANNQALSEARAQAVVAFMAERGVPADGLQAVGYGEAQPIADNATAEGRAQNRRISFDWQAR